MVDKSYYMLREFCCNLLLERFMIGRTDGKLFSFFLSFFFLLFLFLNWNNLILQEWKKRYRKYLLCRSWLQCSGIMQNLSRHHKLNKNPGNNPQENSLSGEMQHNSLVSFANKEDKRDSQFDCFEPILAWRPFWGPRQTVQAQIRRRRTRHLITVHCLLAGNYIKNEMKI